jgi:hypothetical protein
LRPKTHFKNDKIWSDQCKELDHNLPHKERIRACDSLHTSLYNQYLTAFLESGKTLVVEDFVKYLIRRYPFRTFQETVFEDIEDVVKTYLFIFAYHMNEVEMIKKLIVDTKDLEKRIKLEEECEKNPIQGCFHAQKKTGFFKKIFG